MKAQIAQIILFVALAASVPLDNFLIFAATFPPLMFLTFKEIYKNSKN